MGWIELPGGIGKLYVPEERSGASKKHDCEDCFSCQMCSDSRCLVCRANKVCPEQQKAEENSKKR